MPMALRNDGGKYTCQPLGPPVWVYNVNCFPWDMVGWLWLVCGEFLRGVSCPLVHPISHLYRSKKCGAYQEFLS